MFKNFLTSALMAAVVAFTIPLAATTAEAHNNCRTHRSSRTTSRRTTYRRSYASYPAGTYATNGYTTYVTERRPSYYSRHRRLVNTGIGAAAGALIGGLLGGRRGAGLGILAGGAGSQIFTHYQKPRNYTRYR